MGTRHRPSISCLGRVQAQNAKLDAAVETNKTEGNCRADCPKLVVQAVSDTQQSVLQAGMHCAGCAIENREG